MKPLQDCTKLVVVRTGIDKCQESSEVKEQQENVLLVVKTVKGS